MELSFTVLPWERKLLTMRCSKYFCFPVFDKCRATCNFFVLFYRVLGGYGYVGEYKVERLWRDAKLLEIGGGTIEAHHKNSKYRDWKSFTIKLTPANFSLSIIKPSQ
jgi:hypothetical protein